MALQMSRSSLFAVAIFSATAAFAAPTKTEIVQKPDGSWQLIRDGQPFVIKGAGGTNKLDELAACGGNAVRTWGSDNLDPLLAEAQKDHLAVVVGMWLGHTDNGFNYSNAAAVQQQFEACKAAILKYKDNPAVLAWGIGNEMENVGKGDDPKIWGAVEQIAKFAKENDPNHPTMTVIAEIGGNKVEAFNKYCPDIDILGINSYAGATSIPARYAKAGGTKPYVITEFGPPGTWEIGRDSLGLADEATSTAKAAYYEATYTKNVIDNPGHCLGAFAFLWGYKREATATWFGMYLPDGDKVAAVDAMAKLWSGSYPSNRCPEIKSLALDDPKKNDVQPNTKLHAKLDAVDPDGDTIKVDWTLMRDAAMYTTGGADAPIMEDYPKAILSSDASGCDFQMPTDGGFYRLYATLHDGKGGAAVANIPLKVEGTIPPPKGGKVAAFPFALYSGNGGEEPYIPSGYMGDYGNIHMSQVSDGTHGTSSAQKWNFDKSGGWGGVCWQSPANDWGEKAGGFDLTGATKLTFWAKGETGDEKLTFGVGLIGANKKFHDTAKADTTETLTTDWKQYTIDLSGAKDLSMIKTGFYWILKGPKGPTTFYLDQVQFEK